jgi:acyl carrier protein
MIALSNAEGLALLDSAALRDEALLVPVRLDLAAMRTLGEAGTAPALLRDLVGRPSRRPVAAAGSEPDAAQSLRRRLAGLAAAERDELLTELVQEHSAVVLGYSSAEDVGIDRPFKDQGFDSLTALELRNRLGAATGLRLPATLIFDYPAPDLLARHLREEIVPEEESSGGRLLQEIDKLESLVAGLGARDEARPVVAARVKALLAVLQSDDLDEATAEEMFDLLDKELGAP